MVGDARVVGHARVAETSPADGTAVAAPPARVTITFAAKPVTVEGDPLRVYDPSGGRIDDGEVRLERDGEVLSVDLAAGAAATGRYAVAYHVVSADSHVVVGRFTFTVTSGAPAAPDFAPDRRPPRTGPADVRPDLAAVGVGVVGVAGRLRRVRAARRS
ncbi:MAG TPA: copper resistance CopC family protein, partial [Acidimicrobiales bacterium]|nr:copper resistance CopC family protein [Acidimicrobiales bacterium]